jgi:hypothetical protein
MTIVLATYSSLRWSSLGGGGLSLVHAIVSIHDLLSDICSVFFSFFNKIDLFCWSFLFLLFALSSSNITLGWLSNEIIFWDLLSLLFQDPVILIIVVMSTLVH